MKHRTASSAILFSTISSLSAAEKDYSRYTTYPPYCSTPEEVSSRTIPKLHETETDISQSATFTFLHVTTVIRHGDRVPYAKHNCWAGYDDPKVDTSKWECNLHTIASTPSSAAIDLIHQIGPGGEDLHASGVGPFFIYEKAYDANWSPNSTHFPSNMGNDLRGTCQKGQLTLRGYEQQTENGSILRKAYVKHLNKDAQNPDVAELFDFDDEESNIIAGERAYDEPNVYFRSDDDQRTIMSGQVLLRSFFGKLMEGHVKQISAIDRTHLPPTPVLRVHTSDRDRDILSANEKVCPRLRELELEARQSKEYRDLFVNSNEARVMAKFINGRLGEPAKRTSWLTNPDEAIDCIMTTYCSDKELPYVLDVDQSKDDLDLIADFGDNIVQRFIDFNVQRHTFRYKYRDFEYAKVFTNPIWNDILSGLLVFTDANDYEMRRTWPDLREPSKLALYSAHDTTIMAILASLGPAVFDGNEWPPYASMVNIELYEINFNADASNRTRSNFPTGVGFRLVYNGDILTQHISGCLKNEEICDIDLLILHVFQFSNVTEWEDMCQLKNRIQVDDDDGIDEHDDKEDDDREEDKKKPKDHKKRGVRGEVTLFIVGSILTGVCSAFITFLVMSRKVSEAKYQLRSMELMMEDDERADLHLI